MKIAALAFIMLLTVGFAALPIYLTWWLPKRRSRAWVESAALLGLRLQPPPTQYHPVYFGRIFGERDGFRVGCETRAEGNSRSTTYYTQVMVELPHALDAHLYVRPVGGLGRMWNAVTGEDDIQLGDPAIDPAYSISGLDDRVVLLLGHSEVSEALRRHAKASFGLHLRDDRVYLEAQGLHLDAETLGATLDAGIDVAERLLRAKAEVKSSPRWEAMAFA